MKLNNKGFTIIEVLAVIVILGVLSTIMITTIGGALNQNKEDNYKNLKKSIKSAAKAYISDNRYQITLDPNTTCENNNGKRNILSIAGGSNLNSSKITINTLVTNKVLSTNKDGKILNPKNNQEINQTTSYIIVQYDCKTKNYIYDLEDSYIN